MQTTVSLPSIWAAVKKRDANILRQLFSLLPSDASLALDSYTAKSGDDTETALWVAVTNDDYDCVLELVNHGADANETKTHGKSPLRFATARALLANGDQQELRPVPSKIVLTNDK